MKISGGYINGNNERGISKIVNNFEKMGFYHYIKVIINGENIKYKFVKINVLGKNLIDDISKGIKDIFNLNG